MTAESPIESQGETSPTHDKRLKALIIGAIGVVFGDIGTSPLYAFREAMHAASSGGKTVNDQTVLGVVSLFLWAMTLVVTLKYVVLLLRADNKGEGGTLTLVALAQRAFRPGTAVIALLGIVGASMFYGDAMITPAVTVLSAMEGLKLIAPAFEPFIVPATIVIIVALFMVQQQGTGRVAAFFGPVMLIWFVLLGVIGIYNFSADLTVIRAVNPWYAVHFLSENLHIGFITLGAVFLVVTGGEALYADLGHFGRRPIQLSWLWIVFPCLTLNYLGQAALVLHEPSALDNPFYRLVPDSPVFLIPMIAMATMASVIASQAVITGTFSLTRQAMQLGFLPRMRVLHTSEHLHGQIFIAQVNMAVMIGVIVLVLLFQTSSRLASAYGIAVTTAMVVDGLLGFIVIWKMWRWNVLLTLLVIVPFVVIDLVFLAANLLKFHDGGWLPLCFAAALIALMVSWRRGVRVVTERTRRTEVPLDTIIKSIEKGSVARVPGTAIFLTSDPDYTPTALLHSLKHYKSLHEKVAILTITTLDVPKVVGAQHVTIEPLSESFTRIAVVFGYMESPNVPKALALCRKAGWAFDIMSTSFFLSRRHLRPAAKPIMLRWMRRLYMIEARNADDASDYFSIPSDRVVEIGTQVLI